MVRSAESSLCTMLPELLFSEACNNNGQLVWREAVCVVEYRSNRQVFAAYRPVDDDL